jgi:hypothetical protein
MNKDKSNATRHCSLEDADYRLQQAVAAVSEYSESMRLTPYVQSILIAAHMRTSVELFRIANQNEE